jgi:uncharacterized protein (TIGR01370 family)
VTPAASGQFTYTVQCTGAGGSASQAVSLSVPPVPTVAITTNPVSGGLGTSTTVTWSSTNATACTASGAWAGAQSTSGTLSVTPAPLGASSYTLTCTGAGGSANAVATFTANLAFTVSSAAAAPLAAPVRPNPAFTGRLAGVRSWQYAIGSPYNAAGFDAAIGASNMDMVVMGGGANLPPLNRTIADPSHDKIILGYVNIAEAADYTFPQFFAGGPLPPWFGLENPGYDGLYTVQYWNPAWEAAVFVAIDDLIADGFDGIFLDVLSGDNEWTAGNFVGNPVPSVDPVAAMATLVTRIRDHIKAAFPGRTVLLLGNNPSGIARTYPDSLKNLDGILNETVYWVQAVSNGLTSEYKGTAPSFWISTADEPRYRTANVPIFGADYPLPLTDSSQVLLSFGFYSHYGWVPTVNRALQSLQIFSTGPFMYMANATNNTVTGRAGFTNYLSGGLASVATLNGANNGDFFIGGPGQNTITGGAGNDTIYAHPDYAALKRKLIVCLSYSAKGNHTVPSTAISINGATAVPATLMTVAYTPDPPTSVQVFTVDLATLTSISSLELVVTNTSFVDPNNFSNVVIHRIIYDGVGVDLSLGAYPNGGALPGFTYTNKGTVTYPATAFATSSPYLINTSDNIDGGGGTNTVVYRARSTNYTVTKQTGGSWTVTSSATAEGPDTLRNIQSVVFTDKTITLN